MCFVLLFLCSICSRRYSLTTCVLIGVPRCKQMRRPRSEAEVKAITSCCQNWQRRNKICSCSMHTKLQHQCATASQVTRQYSSGKMHLHRTESHWVATSAATLYSVWTLVRDSLYVCICWEELQLWACITHYIVQFCQHPGACKSQSRQKELNYYII